MSNNNIGSIASNNTSSLSAPLPLGWTRINKRKRKIVTNSNDENDEGIDFFCCEDPNCNERQDKDNSKSKEIVEKEKQEDEKEPKNRTASLSGKGLFCLHTLDCKWFQGHFIPARMNASSSFGLLAVERDDIDECLQCRDGGYKEIDLTFLSASKKWKKESSDSNKKRKKLKVDRLTCTGGDMLRIANSDLTSNDNVEVKFNADRVITGMPVESLVRRYFPNLLTKATNTESVLEILPDCAIVIGDMSIRVPSEFVYSSEDAVVPYDIDNDWLE